MFSYWVLNNCRVTPDELDPESGADCCLVVSFGVAVELGELRDCGDRRLPRIVRSVLECWLESGCDPCRLIREHLG